MRLTMKTFILENGDKLEIHDLKPDETPNEVLERLNADEKNFMLMSNEENQKEFIERISLNGRTIIDYRK